MGKEKLKDLEGLEKKKQMAILKNLTCNNKPKKVCCVMPNLKSDERLDLFKEKMADENTTRKIVTDDNMATDTMMATHESTEILTKIISKTTARPSTTTTTTTATTTTAKTTKGPKTAATTTRRPTTTPKPFRDCKADQKCVNDTTCNSFQQKRQFWNDLEKNTLQYNTTLEELRSLVCNNDERKVCCDITEIVSTTPTPSTERPRPKTPPPTGCANPDSPCHRPSLEEEKCGLDNSDAGFFGVEGTRIGEFPFLVLLGSKRGGDSVSWQCGGTLINKTAIVRPDSEQHLCTRGREGEERETCSITGTGEPLMGRLNDLSPWQLIGVASGGGGRCEAGGLEVFTRVTNYEVDQREHMVDQREHGLKD